MQAIRQKTAPAAVYEHVTSRSNSIIPAAYECHIGHSTLAKQFASFYLQTSATTNQPSVFISQSRLQIYIIIWIYIVLYHTNTNFMNCIQACNTEVAFLKPGGECYKV